jgi:hypothetical protein
LLNAARDDAVQAELDRLTDVALTIVMGADWLRERISASRERHSSMIEAASVMWLRKFPETPSTEFIRTRLQRAKDLVDVRRGTATGSPADWRAAFPDANVDAMPPIPPEWTDVSWRNDACPSFMVEGKGMLVHVEREIPAERENGPECPRYSVLIMDPDESGWQVDMAETLIDGDDWEEILKAVSAYDRDSTAVCEKTAEAFGIAASGTDPWSWSIEVDSWWRIEVGLAGPLGDDQMEPSAFTSGWIVDLLENGDWIGQIPTCDAKLNLAQACAVARGAADLLSGPHVMEEGRFLHEGQAEPGPWPSVPAFPELPTR